jgi:hypothetical protein
MALTLALSPLWRDETEVRPERPRTADWPLMGDIVSARGGVPEHLIRWRRAEGEADPDPQT